MTYDEALRSMGWSPMNHNGRSVWGTTAGPGFDLSSWDRYNADSGNLYLGRTGGGNAGPSERDWNVKISGAPTYDGDRLYLPEDFDASQAGVTGVPYDSGGNGLGGLLPVIGTAAGAFFGGPVGAGIGNAAGTLLGGGSPEQALMGGGLTYAGGSLMGGAFPMDESGATSFAGSGGGGGVGDWGDFGWGDFDPFGGNNFNAGASQLSGGGGTDMSGFMTPQDPFALSGTGGAFNVAPDTPMANSYLDTGSATGYNAQQFYNDFGFSPQGYTMNLADSGGPLVLSGQQGASTILNMLRGLPAAAKSQIQKMVPGLFKGDGSINLAKLGAGAALVAGLLEKPNNPLTAPLVDAVRSGISNANNIAGLKTPGITPSIQRGIDTTNANVGAWRPYVEEGAGNLRAGASPVSGGEISAFMNPFVEQALDPAARKIREQAALTRQGDAARAGARGAFGTPRNDQLLKLDDRNQLTALGDLYGQGYASAFNTALGTATAGKNRQLSAGGAFVNTGGQVSNLNAADTSGLYTAGGAERLPYTDELGKLTAAGSAFSGVAGAAANGARVTGTPSRLGQAIGGIGAISQLDKMGAF